MKALFNSLWDFCFDGFKIQPFRKKYFQPVYNPEKNDWSILSDTLSYNKFPNPDLFATEINYFLIIF